MTDDHMRLFAAGAADVDRIIAGIAPEQLDAATPCADWDVRALLNHLIGGNRMFLAMARDEPMPDRGQDFIGADPLASFRASVADLTEAFGAPGFAERTITAMWFGEVPGVAIVGMRRNEFLLHGWDLAAATGQARDFDAEVVAAADAGLRARAIPRGSGHMFDEEQPAPPGASAVDALAAYTGRRLP
jgi:uncharacterized protein (TIGR03086 family)